MGKTFDQIREARVINTKKMSAYQKFAKSKKVDDDSVRMAHDNPNHPESKRMMKNKHFAKALGMYKSAKESAEVSEGIAGAVAGGVAGGLAGGPAGAAAGAYLGHKIQQAGNAAKKKKENQPTTVGPGGQKPAGPPKRENSDAVKAFLAKGGKIKKLPPGRAQGAHGKDDPGKGMTGMLDRGDTKRFGTRKKVRSMESVEPVQEEMMFKVSVEGLPPMIMLGKSPGDIKGRLRKIVKQPSMVGDIDRMTKSEVKKRYRDMGAGKEDKE